MTITHLLVTRKSFLLGCLQESAHAFRREESVGSLRQTLEEVAYLPPEAETLVKIGKFIKVQGSILISINLTKT